MKFLFGLFLFVVLFAFMAAAQEPEPQSDVPLGRTAGVYNAGCLADQTDTDLISGCFVRADVTPVTELGCTTEVSTRADDVLKGMVFRMDFAVQQTTFDDAEIRCYVTDIDFSSEYSFNAGIIDFTPPARGRLIASCVQPPLVPFEWMTQRSIDDKAEV